MKMRNETDRRQSWARLVAAAALATAIAGCSAGAPGPDRDGTTGIKARDPLVTPVSGESWLKHLGLTPSQTHMGQMGGLEPAPVTARDEPDIAEEGTGGTSGGMGRMGGGMGRSGGMGGMRGMGGMMGRFMRSYRGDQDEASRALAEPFQVTGEDLYRLSCQSCHGPDGRGAPPEIKSLLDPVRGSSVEAIRARMKKLGRTISPEMAKQLAEQGKAGIRKRLENGGEKMPPFPHLKGDEVDALLGYLDTLAGVASDDGGGGGLVEQSAARVGEHLAKGTCHVCHGATGPGGGHMAMMRGIIPSLASMPDQLSLSSVERQVDYGSVPMMGMMAGGQRMPAMPYLTEDEIAAAYFYLAVYPPQP